VCSCEMIWLIKIVFLVYFLASRHSKKESMSVVDEDWCNI